MYKNVSFVGFEAPGRPETGCVVSHSERKS